MKHPNTGGTFYRQRDGSLSTIKPEAPREEAKEETQETNQPEHAGKKRQRKGE